MKKIVYLIISLFYIASYGQNSQSQKNQFLLSAVLKLETKVEKTKAEIGTIEKNNLKCDATINKSETILTQAKQKGNAEAERIAQKSIATATEAKNNNLRLITELKLSNVNADNALNAIKKEMLKPSNNNITSVINNFSGNVQIKKVNYEKIYYLDKGSPVFLEEGDIITTDKNGKVEMQFLDGRGNVTIGASSKLKMEEDSSGKQTMNLMNGKVNVKVEKADDYDKWMNTKLKEWNESGSVDAELNKLVAKTKKEFKNYIRKKFEVRTPSVVLADRGTQFIVLEYAQKCTEVILLEGSVEMKGVKNNKTVIINEGYEGIVTVDGEVSEPQKIEISNLEKWRKE